ncbi:MAG: acetate--CoA ligase family protein, partial [Devosia sp.]
MTIRNLDLALRPNSVAIIGASERSGSVGKVVLQNMRQAGFAGAIYPVNPKYDELSGLRCYRQVPDLPAAPDLAVIMTPPQSVPDLIDELGKKGCKVAVVLTAGLTATNGLRKRMLDAAAPYLLRVIGPNTIGILSPTLGLNASFSHIAAPPGRLALLSQSGAIATTLIDWARAEGVGFSHVVSMGDMADVDVGDLVNLLARDQETAAILLYLESIPQPRKFLSAVRAAARSKPVVVVKPGRHAAAAKAAATHTGALAGADRVVDAALRRAGAVRVFDLQDLFAAAETIARFPPAAAPRLAVVTNGGGAGVLAIDQLIDENIPIAELSDATIAALDATLPATWSRANPVDIIGDAPPERYRAAIDAVAADPGVDAILAMNCPTGLASPEAAAHAVADAVTNGLIGGKPIFACWLGEYAARGARTVLQEAGVASFDTPAQAAQAVGFLSRWTRLQAKLRRVPESRNDAISGEAIARPIFVAVAAEGRTMLTEPEAKVVIKAYGIPVPELIVAATLQEVETAATKLLETAPRIVVKLLSKAISHKSDIGGVALDLQTPGDAAAAARAMLERVASTRPEAAIDGFALQPMIRRGRAVELIAGVNCDPSFGPTILFGAGGISVEVVDDTAIGLVPLDEVLAGDLIDRTRVSRLLAGYRDRPAADRNAIIGALNGLSQLIVDFPCVKGVDINPLLADADGVIALDARIEIDPVRVLEKGPNPDLAIRPYPSGWERIVAGPYRIRPIRPIDAELYPRFLEKVTPEDIRLRFLSPI